MAKDDNKGDFIDFIIKATGNEGLGLAKKFLEKKEPGELYKFFQKKKYLDISKEECGRILDAINNGLGKGISVGREPVQWDGPSTKSY